MARSRLLIGSILLHAGLGITMFATGVWKLERLDVDTRLANLAVMMPPAAPEGGASGSPTKEANHPKHKEKQVAKEPTQPVETKPDEPPVEKPTAEVGVIGDGGGQGSASGPGVGNGPPDSTGSCVGDACSPDGPPQPPEPPKPKPAAVVPATKFVPPTILSALRTWGDTQIHPSDNTKTQMLREGRDSVTGGLQVCLGADGRITSVTVRVSTKYPEYDQKLVEAARGWRYKPMLVNGSGVPVCGMTTFVYAIK